MFNFLADALDFFYEIWPSYGGSIVLFTLAIMLVLSPLSIKSARGMIRLQRLQPELKKLQAQYKGDREALNREMMAFYQANNVNPFSSCLPLLLQMPVFIILYRVLSGLTQKGSDGFFNPKYLDPDSSLRAALQGTKEMMSFGMDLSQSALTELKTEGIVTALPFFILVALTVGSQFFQQKQIQGRNAGNANVNPQQQMITRIMPLVFIPITLSIPAGVVIYFVVSNAVRIGQQAIVTRLEYGDGKGSKPIVVPTPQGPPPKGDGTAAAKARPTTSGRVTPSGATATNRNRNKRKRK